MEWLDRGTYEHDPMHPPLGRVAAAAGLYLQGVRSSPDPDPILDGNAILGGGEADRSHLTVARLGTLPFLLLSCMVLWGWSWWSFGSETAAVAVLLFSSLPSILGHASMAMTDIALAATLPLALLSFCLWLNRCTAVQSAMLGLAVGLAILSKFSALPFVAVCGILLIGMRCVSSKAVLDRIPARLAMLAFATLCTALVIWAGYRFSLTASPDGPHRKIDRITGST